ncbi:MAG TPA: hypothetical protein VGT01_02500 [Candidatus Dormibacteraeota bacterium]|nr:hypothetical protein [Candidatus Dormibacteraeota bacterium]
MDAYSTTNWGLAFTATAGASAALTGLIFVALSINLKQVVATPGLVARAIEVIVLLTSALIISTLLLMPGQTVDADATEVLTVAIAVGVTLLVIHVRTDRKALGIGRFQFGMRIVGSQMGPVFLLIGGVSLFVQNGGGLYWVAPALLAAMVAAIIGAWVLLVEIVR